MHGALQHIRSLGKKAGIALNPSTPAALINEILDMVDLVLVMTVNPGFGGQTFIAETLGKIREVRNALRLRGRDCDVEVDGGINLDTAYRVVEAGADVLVAGSAVYDSKLGVAAAIRQLHAAATGHAA